MENGRYPPLSWAFTLPGLSEGVQRYCSPGPGRETACTLGRAVWLRPSAPSPPKGLPLPGWVSAGLRATELLYKNSEGRM